MSPFENIAFKYKEILKNHNKSSRFTLKAFHFIIIATVTALEFKKITKS